MDSANDEVPAKRIRAEGHEKTQIPQETMLVVLLWLDRFDLDGKQITVRRLRSLVENNQMPLRKVKRVDYDGDERRYWDPPVENHTLSIRLEGDDEDGPPKVEFRIATQTDAQKAVSYLSSCFVCVFGVHGHHVALPKNAIIAAPTLIRELYFRRCSFDNGEAADALNETLNGTTFRSLALIDSSIPVWQIDDSLLESLRLYGCNDLNVCYDAAPFIGDETFALTEEGLLSYCFTLDDAMPVPENRTLRFTWASITPAFFKKLVEASKNSQVTCDVKLCLEHLWFDVGNLDVGVQPSRWQEYDRYAAAHLHNVRYNMPDHGNGIRLLIHFTSENGEEWEVAVRHGKKEHEEFFDPKPAEEESDEEYWEHDRELLEDRDYFDRFDWD